MSKTILTPAAVRRRAPASAKSEQRIRDILQVAREALSEKGYEHATTHDIAQRLGISEATVFTYFRGKRELCVRVISEWYDDIIAEMEQALSPPASARVQLRTFIETHLRLFLVHGTGLCALVLSEGRSKGGLGQELAGHFHGLQRRYTAPLMAVLARGQAVGEVRSDVPLRLLRSMVLGPMEHILWEWIGQDKPIDIPAAADQLMAVLWSGIAAPRTELQALRRFQSEVDSALRRVQGAV